MNETEIRAGLAEIASLRKLVETANGSEAEKAVIFNRLARLQKAYEARMLSLTAAAPPGHLMQCSVIGEGELAGTTLMTLTVRGGFTHARLEHRKNTPVDLAAIFNREAGL